MKLNTYEVDFGDALIIVNALNAGNAVILASAQRINSGLHIGAKTVYYVETGEIRELDSRGAFPSIAIKWK